MLALCWYASAATLLPSGLAGTYVISSVEGDSPGLLGVAKADDLVGKKVTVSNDGIVLWTV